MQRNSFILQTERGGCEEAKGGEAEEGGEEAAEEAAKGGEAEEGGEQVLLRMRGNAASIKIQQWHVAIRPETGPRKGNAKLSNVVKSL